jgi:hypothetical protein
VELEICDSGLFIADFGEADREARLGTVERCPGVEEVNFLSAHAEFQWCGQGRPQVYMVSAAAYQKSSIG